MLTLLALLAAEPLPEATLGQAESLPPAEAGELLLGGREHDRVVSIERLGGMRPPLMTELEMIERPRAVPGGCVRRRWTATFTGSFDGPEADRRLKTLRASEEVALADDRSCPEAGYAYRNFSLGTERALALLRVLDEALAPGSEPSFTCRDEAEGRLCAGPAAIRKALSSLHPWALSERDGIAEYWLGVRGEVITIVKLRPDDPAQISVLRQVPAPF